MNTKKQIISKIVAAVLILVMLAGVAEKNISTSHATGSVKIGKGMYTITNPKKKEARFDKVSDKSATTVTIPATVKIKKKNYKVISIKSNALKGNTKIKKLTIGKNVKTIGSKAFYGCKNLKTIALKTNKLTAKNVGKDAFGKLDSKVNIKMPVSKKEAYNKILNSKGLSDGDYTEKTSSENEDKIIPPDGKPTPELELYFKKTQNGVSVPSNTLYDSEYKTGDNLILEMLADMPKKMYGYWTTSKKQVNRAYTIGQDNYLRWFDNTEDLAHNGSFGISTGEYMIYKFNPSREITAWHWNYDETPCQTTFHFTLPTGITCDPTSIVVVSGGKEINPLDGDYSTEIYGQDITVTFNNIKSDPYRTSLGRRGTVVFVQLTARMDENAADISQVNANLTYTYKGVTESADTNTVTIRKKADETVNQ